MGHPVLKNLQVVVGIVGAAVILLTMQGPLRGQQRGGAAQGDQPPATARTSAPYDVTGYWVSEITNNWRTRMVPPPLGDYADMPLTAAAKKVADAWDPAKDEAAGNQCKYYGAASIMFQPERIHIAWQDDNTLRMDIDSGTQTRVFRFGKQTSSQGKRTWQGDSAAEWEPRGRGDAQTAARSLKVTTTNMLPGYLRKNGVPYSESAVLTEYYDLIQEPDGRTMMIITIAVEDPEFLERKYIVVAHFKKQSDAAGWDPAPCSARW